MFVHSAKILKKLTAYHKCGTVIIMNENDCTIYSGAKFTIEWYYDKDGVSIAKEFFLKSSEELQDKFI